MSNKTKYLIGLLGTILVLAILGLAFFLSNKKIRNLSINNNLIPEVKKEEVNNQQKFVDLYNQGNFTELNKLLDSQLSNNPGNFDLLLQKGNALAQEASLAFKEKELGDRAMDFVNQALDINPDSVEALTLKGYIYEIQQDYVNAHKYYDQALKIDPNNVNTLAQKGHAYYLTGEVAKSEIFYRKALKLAPDMSTVLAGIGKVLTAQGKDKEAKEIFLKIAALTKNSREKSEAYYSAAVLGSNIKGYNPQEIESMVEEALSADPTFAMPYIKKSEILIDKAVSAKDKETKISLTAEAFASVEKSIELNKNQAMAHFQLMQNFYQVGQIKEAKIVLKNLPSIIDKDITLSKNEKDDLKKILIALQDKIK